FWLNRWPGGRTGAVFLLTPVVQAQHDGHTGTRHHRKRHQQGRHGHLSRATARTRILAKLCLRHHRPDQSPQRQEQKEHATTLIYTLWMLPLQRSGHRGSGFWRAGLSSGLAFLKVFHAVWFLLLSLGLSDGSIAQSRRHPQSERYA